MPNNKDNFIYVIWTFLLLLLFGLLVISALTNSTTSDLERINELQQERFKYEREQHDIKQQMELRETLNKIESGYYD